MTDKITAPIKSIKVNRATFHDVEIERPTFINFFYGNNGTGKTSIAHAIKDGDGVEWSDGHTASDFELHVYNQDFINDHFSSYGNLRGVFTVNKVNIEILKKVEEKTAERKKMQDDYSAATAELQEKQGAPARLLATFQDDCFKKTKSLREDFDVALAGKKQKKGFVDALLAEANPTDHDIEELKRLCDTAFDDTTREYPLFSRVATASTYGKLPGKELLDKVIVSSSDTPFAKFWKAINASDWVRNGHDHYGKMTDGKCPYCKQTLPPNFEAEIAACFDEQYQQDIQSIAQFRKTYESETAGIIRTLKSNMSDVLPTVDLTEYQEKLTLLERSIELNDQRLAEKVSEPSKIISLEDTDSLLIEIGNLIDAINQKIKANNDVVKGRRASKNKCKTDIMQYFAFLLADDIKSYRAEKAALEKAASDSAKKVDKLKKDIRNIGTEIAHLNSQTVNTSDAMNAINRMLKESGFQGFSLRAKEGVDNTYEVVRENGDVAEDLSEGERNFIAFLYFHQMVCGSMNSEEVKDKIVVIDDPVSSMDSTSLFFISGIVREMINVCRNNTSYLNQKVSGNYIKQIFILTHNVYFHKEITYQQARYYDCTSFYMIRKKNNHSTVKLCIRQKTDAPTEEENYNPVQNSYAALWDELRKVETTNTAKNVMRRILEYYFLQLCGYEGDDLRERILESDESRNKFIVPVKDGQPDTTNYELAMSLLTYIDSAHDIGDGMNYIEDTDDVDAYKNVFKLIFDALGQIQHYNMMMGKLPES